MQGLEPCVLWLSLLYVLPSLSQSLWPARLPQTSMPQPGQSPDRVSSTPGTPLLPCGSLPACPAAPSVGAIQQPQTQELSCPLCVLWAPTLCLLSLAGRSRGAILSQYYNRTARLRRRSSRPPLQQLCRAARPSLRLYDLETDPTTATLQGEHHRALSPQQVWDRHVLVAASC